MAKLSTMQRNRLPASDFAVPGQRKYPIENESHARNALARSAQHASPELQAKIKAKVRRKFPSIAVEGEKPKHRLDRPGRKK